MRDLPLRFGIGTKSAVWFWHDGGTVDLASREVTVALRNLTGFDGRCDAVPISPVRKTMGMMGEVVGKAATIAVRRNCAPRDVYTLYWSELDALLKLPGRARRRPGSGVRGHAAG